MTSLKRMRRIGLAILMAGFALTALACGGLGSTTSPDKPTGTSKSVSPDKQVTTTAVPAFKGKPTRAEFMKKLEELDESARIIKERNWGLLTYTVVNKKKLFAAFGEPSGDSQHPRGRLWTYRCSDSILVFTIQSLPDGAETMIMILETSYYGI